MNEELYKFVNDVYDVLVGNDHLCTQRAFIDSYVDIQDVEINCATNTIYIGKFKIQVSRNE